MEQKHKKNPFGNLTIASETRKETLIDFINARRPRINEVAANLLDAIIPQLHTPDAEGKVPLGKVSLTGRFHTDYGIAIGLSTQSFARSSGWLDIDGILIDPAMATVINENGNPCTLEANDLVVFSGTLRKTHKGGNTNFIFDQGVVVVLEKVDPRLTQNIRDARSRRFGIRTQGQGQGQGQPPDIAVY